MSNQSINSNQALKIGVAFIEKIWVFDIIIFGRIIVVKWSAVYYSRMSISHITSSLYHAKVRSVRPVILCYYYYYYFKASLESNNSHCYKIIQILRLRGEVQTKFLSEGELCAHHGGQRTTGYDPCPNVVLCQPLSSSPMVIMDSCVRWRRRGRR